MTLKSGLLTRVELEELREFRKTWKEGELARKTNSDELGLLKAYKITSDANQTDISKKICDSTKGNQRLEEELEAVKSCIPVKKQLELEKNVWINDAKELQFLRQREKVYLDQEEDVQCPRKETQTMSNEMASLQLKLETRILDSDIRSSSLSKSASRMASSYTSELIRLDALTYALAWENDVMKSKYNILFAQHQCLK